MDPIVRWVGIGRMAVGRQRAADPQLPPLRDIQSVRPARP